MRLQHPPLGLPELVRSSDERFLSCTVASFFSRHPRQLLVALDMPHSARRVLLYRVSGLKSRMRAHRSELRAGARLQNCPPRGMISVSVYYHGSLRPSSHAAKELSQALYRVLDTV